MNYNFQIDALERRINNKADKWDIDDIRNQLSQLKSDILSINNILSYLQKDINELKERGLND